MYDITEPVVTLLGIGLVASGSASLTAESNLTSAASVVTFGESVLSGESALTADAVNVLVAASSLSSESDLVSAVTVGLDAASSLSAQSNLVAGIFQTWQGAAALSAEVTLTITENIVAAAAALANGGSNLVADGVTARVANPQPLSSNCDLVVTISIGAPVAARPVVFSSDMEATVYTPSKYLVLPTIELTYTDNILLRRYGIDNGQALLITGTVGTLSTFPAQQEIADADYYFRGGATNILDDTEEAAVIAAGYGQYIVVE